MPTITYIVCSLVEKGKSIPHFLTETTFGLYSVHVLPDVFISTMILPRMFNLHNDSCCLILYLVVPILLIAFSTGIYSLLKKNIPSTLAFESGNRK